MRRKQYILSIIVCAAKGRIHKPGRIPNHGYLLCQFNHVFKLIVGRGKSSCQQQSPGRSGDILPSPHQQRERGRLAVSVARSAIIDVCCTIRSCRKNCCRKGKVPVVDAINRPIGSRGFVHHVQNRRAVSKTFSSPVFFVVMTSAGCNKLCPGKTPLPPLRVHRQLHGSLQPASGKCCCHSRFSRQNKTPLSSC